MKIAVFMDSFKGSLSSVEAGKAVKEGVFEVDENTIVKTCPFADGGEGTLEAFLATGGKTETVRASDPIGRRINASYGILEDGTCVIESAKAIGLCLLPDIERNPLYTTTRGLGEIILGAVKNGSRKFIIGIGGSSTNDCGIGMLQALGFDIRNEKGEEVGQGAKGLCEAISISKEHVMPELARCQFTVACDVQNPLCGSSGASLVYGPQKGASVEECEKMDRWMRQFSEVVKESYPQADPEEEGAGAAGGLGFAIKTFLSGKMRSGADILFEKTKAEDLIRDSDLIITGEGRIDGQTAMGKAPVRIAKLAKKHHKPVIAFAGSIGDGAKDCYVMGVDEIIPITKEGMPLELAMKREVAYRNLAAAVRDAYGRVLNGSMPVVQGR